MIRRNEKPMTGADPTPAKTYGPIRVWRAGLSIARDTILEEPFLGAKRLLLPVSYWRSREFAFVLNCLRDESRPARVLDLGSPKSLASMVVRRFGVDVCATDVMSEPVWEGISFARAQGLTASGRGVMWGAVEDGRSLPHPDDSFDAAYSVSVLEHIPDRGDSIAVAELGRVVRPGGLIALTVPYSLEYRETWVDRSVYEREQSADERLFYQRHYDASALRTRLVMPSECELVAERYWGETGVSLEAQLSDGGGLSWALSPIEAFLATVFLERTPPADSDAMAAFLALRVPERGF